MALEELFQFEKELLKEYKVKNIDEAIIVLKTKLEEKKLNSN